MPIGDGKYSDTEAQRRLAEQMGDWEFEQAVINLMGDRAKPHVRNVNWDFRLEDNPEIPGPENTAWEQGYAGRYTSPEAQAEVTMELREAGLLGPGEWLPDGHTITLLPPGEGPTAAGLGVMTQAHELEHYIAQMEGKEQDFLNHLDIYARMGHYARTKEEWDEAVLTLQWFLQGRGFEPKEGKSWDDVMRTYIADRAEMLIDEEREAEGRTAAAVSKEEEGILMQGGNPLPYYGEGQE